MGVQKRSRMYAKRRSGCPASPTAKSVRIDGARKSAGPGAFNFAPPGALVALAYLAAGRKD